MEIGASSASAGLHATLYSSLRGGADTLSPEQQQQINKLRQTDQKVRAHEAAHQAAGAGLTGGASLQTVRGPDGKQYAVAGEVRIDASPAGTPEQTIEKARRIQAAALAPADPSAQDRAVAAQAAQMALQAQAELNRIRRESGDSVNAATSQAALAAYADGLTPQPEPTVSLYA